MNSTSLDKTILHIDIETYSSIDLPDCGVFRYVEAPDFEILLIAYAYNDTAVKLIDLKQEGVKDSIEYRLLVQHLQDPKIIKVAHNCAFERACLSRYLGIKLPPEEWEDTMLLASMSGLPLHLGDVAAALNLEQQKDKEGKALIRYFSIPCKPTKVNGQRTRNLPEHSPERWEKFKAYCKQDVETERAIYDRLNVCPVPPFEHDVFCTDARINERGVLIDADFVRAAVDIDENLRARQVALMQSLTGLENPNSVAQLKEWLSHRGISVESLNKVTVAELQDGDIDPVTRKILGLRAQLGKTSTTKYSTMLNAQCEDGRIRGLLQYYGAPRTGRWAGRLVQLQNLPQNHIDNIATVRELVRAGDLESLEIVFPSVPDVLSQLIRTALIAPEGKTFLVADYSAIEARVIAYLSGEKWRQEVFANGGDIYCSSASQMFKVPVEKHGVNAHLRQKGKVAELACGYGGGVGALKAFGADKMGLTEEEMQDIVSRWRTESPTIPKFWQESEQAARTAIDRPGSVFRIRSGISMYKDRDALRIRLPSGRYLNYWHARIDDNGHIVYQGQKQGTKIFGEIETWGGKLVENIVQGFARDCLAAAILRLDRAGYQICFHVHDEIIAEAPKGSSWEGMAEIMCQPLKWASGLLLNADGYTTDFYMKD